MHTEHTCSITIRGRHNSTHTTATDTAGESISSTGPGRTRADPHLKHLAPRVRVGVVVDAVPLAVLAVEHHKRRKAVPGQLHAVLDVKLIQLDLQFLQPLLRCLEPDGHTKTMSMAPHVPGHAMCAQGQHKQHTHALATKSRTQKK
jgi:hypothetical protein